MKWQCWSCEGKKRVRWNNLKWFWHFIVLFFPSYPLTISPSPSVLLCSALVTALLCLVLYSALLCYLCSTQFCTLFFSALCYLFSAQSHTLPCSSQCSAISDILSTLLCSALLGTYLAWLRALLSLLFHPCSLLSYINLWDISGTVVYVPFCPVFFFFSIPFMFSLPDLPFFLFLWQLGHCLLVFGGKTNFQAFKVSFNIFLVAWHTSLVHWLLQKKESLINQEFLHLTKQKPKCNHQFQLQSKKDCQN